MISAQLVDPELLATLEQLPTSEMNDGTLSEMRAAMAALRLPAPAAPDVSAEEIFVDTVDARSIRLVVYPPKATPYTGALLWIHGGGMVMGVPEMNDAQSRYLADKAQCVVIAVAYRLAPEAPFPAGLDDCYAALGWISRHARDLGVPADRIAIAAESGGGALAVGVSLLARDRHEYPISAQFLMYPMLDDRTGSAADPTPMPFAGEFVWKRESNAFAWHSVLAETFATPSLYASPGRAESLTGLPATFVAIGDLDLFIGENLRFAQRLIRDGVPTELHVYRGATHGFTSFGGDTRIAVRGREDFWAAIARHFLRF